MKKQRGASLVEYSLLVALIVVISAGALKVYYATTTKPFCLATGALMFGNSTTSVEWEIDPDSKLPHCYSPTSPFPLW